jgi:uncharacterized protein
MSASVIYWIVLALMLVGIIGAFVPGIPGMILVVVGVVIWGFVKGFDSSLMVPIIVTAVVFLLNFGIDFLAGYWGAKKFGASSWGQIGAVIGMVLGLFGLLPALPFGGPLLGLLVGPILGAFVGEFLYQRRLELTLRIKQSFLSSIGIVVGSVLGKVMQGLLTLVAVAVFIFSTWPTAFTGS